MTGPPPFATPPSSAGGSGLNTENTNTPSLQEIILAQMSSLKELINEHNSRSDTVTPIHLDFESDQVTRDKGKEIEETEDDDLRKPFKETT